MTHRGPFQLRIFCDSVMNSFDKLKSCGLSALWHTCNYTHINSCKWNFKCLFKGTPFSCLILHITHLLKVYCFYFDIFLQLSVALNIVACWTNFLGAITENLEFLKTYYLQRDTRVKEKLIISAEALQLFYCSYCPFSV